MKILKVYQEWPKGYKNSWSDAASHVAEAIQIKLSELGDDVKNVLVEVYLVEKDS